MLYFVKSGTYVRPWLNKVHDNKTSLCILDNGDWVSRDDIADALRVSDGFKRY